jgi:ABC-type transporter Mla subunit MlaD
MSESQDLILKALNELRDDVKEVRADLKTMRDEVSANAKEFGERLAKLEVVSYALNGNGQPGRVKLLEDAVKKLQQFRWYLGGFVACGDVATIAAAWIWANFHQHLK